MGGWMKEKSSGNIGTTKQIEDAHKELDEVGIDPGPLAMRAFKAALILKNIRNSPALKVVDL